MINHKKKPPFQGLLTAIGKINRWNMSQAVSGGKVNSFS